jgi:hypothetical protein
MSRAAKGADCKSAGYAFAGSSPASPTIFIFWTAQRRGRLFAFGPFGAFLFYARGDAREGLSASERFWRFL